MKYHFLHFFSFILILSTDCEGKKKNELQIDVQYKPEDCEVQAQVGDQVSVHYTGYLESGVVFDSSVQTKRDPVTFTLGEHTVIKGWEQSIQGMCVGEKRKLNIPPHLAYGAQGRPPVIPADATLTFEVELMGLQKKSFEKSIMQTVQFLSIPALILYVIYYLYDKYKKETKSLGKSKEDKRGKKKK